MNAPNRRPEAALDRQRWIAAAMEALIAGGVGAVRITRLADALAITRGSFYWHFRDRDDLLAALRRRWEGQNTQAVLDAVEDAVTLDAAILAFFDAWVLPDRFDARLEDAMRAWAKEDEAIRRAIEAADERRVMALAATFRRFGCPGEEAFVRARILYFAQIGYFALGLAEPMEARLALLETYFRCFTGRDIAPEAATTHRARHAGDR